MITAVTLSRESVVYHAWSTIRLFPGVGTFFSPKAEFQGTTRPDKGEKCNRKEEIALDGNTSDPVEEKQNNNISEAVGCLIQDACQV